MYYKKWKCKKLLKKQRHVFLRRHHAGPVVSHILPKPAAANSTSTRIVLVVMSGSGVAVPWAAASPRVAAIIQHFYPGVLGGEAICADACE